MFITKMSFLSFSLIYLLTPFVAFVWIIRNEEEIREQFHWFRIQENCKMLTIEDEQIKKIFPIVLKYGTFFE